MADPAIVDKVLATIRQRESGGNYTAKNKTSTASGAYQFINATWRSLGGSKFAPTAREATAAQQDEIARKYVESILDANGGDVTAVPRIWYVGSLSKGDNYLPPGNTLTVGQYVKKWMSTYGGDSVSSANASSATSFQGNTATATGGTTVIPDLPPNSTQAQIDAHIRRYYPQAAPFLQIPEIAAIFTAPGAGELDSIEIEAKLRQTNYWQTHGAPSRALDALYGSDKQAADALVTGVKRTFKDLFARNGVTLTDEQSSLYARRMLRAGYVNLNGQITDPDAINDLLATHLRVAKVFADAGVPLTAGAADGESTEQRIVRITGEVQSGKRTIEDVTKSVGRISSGLDPSQRTTGGAELGGELANNADAMTAKARQFLVPISRQDAEAWSLRILDGSASEESFTAWLTGLAKARYASQPDILAAIEGGLTPSAYFASHQATVAKLLELSPDQIDLLDPKWSWMTETVDKNGNRRAPTLGEVQQMARDRPEFAQTRQYKELSSGYALEMSRFIGASA